MNTQTKTPTKPLFILVSDGGDGSYSLKMTLDKVLIDKMNAYDEMKGLNYGDDPGTDGDGFHYTTLNVPADATYESLGIKYPFLDTGRYDLDDE